MAAIAKPKEVVVDDAFKDMKKMNKLFSEGQIEANFALKLQQKEQTSTSKENSKSVSIAQEELPRKETK